MTAGTALWFDLDGTLLQFDDPYEEVLGSVFETHLGASDPALATAYEEAFFPAFEALEPEPYRTGMAAVVEAADGDADPDAMVETLLDAECAATGVDPAARESLDELAASAALGVVTNGVREWQVAKLAHHGLDDRFDAVVASYEAGAHKPDAAPFDLARERIDAEEHAMVGDDYEADVEGARAAGFVPVHFEESDGPGFWTTLRAMVA